MTVLVQPAWAFLFETPILSYEQIQQLPDNQLTDKYLDVIVELTAVQTFYSNTTFTPNEYNKLKALLKYRILLIQEMEKRKIEPPRVQ